MKKSIIQMLVLALMIMSASGGDGGDTNSDTQGTDSPQTDSPQTDSPQTDTPQTATQDTQCTDGQCTQGTQGTEGCATQDTQQCDATCSYDGPQVHGGFMDGPCGTDSNPCCIEYRFGPFVYVDPIINPTPLDFSWGSSTYVPPRIDEPSRGRASGSDGYGYGGMASARPDWETHEWQCHSPSLEDPARECGHFNNPIYNAYRCGECNVERPEDDVAPKAPLDVDPLSLLSPDVEEGAERAGTCCVCIERVNEVVLLGRKNERTGEYACRHQCMCRQCAKTMRGLTNTAARRCPMCRVPTQFFVVADTIPRSADVSAYK